MKDHKKFVKKFKKKVNDNLPCGEGLSGKICRVNNKKLNKSESGYYQFDNAKVRIDSTQADLAQQTANPELVDYIKSAAEADLPKIKLQKGTLTLYKKDEGLFSGFFSDTSGQVVEKFDDMTIPMLVKAMEVKSLVAQNAPVRSQPQTSENAPSHVKIKYGDFELEIKKSLSGFIDNFKKHRNGNRVRVMKAIQAWRRNTVAGQSHSSNLSAAQEILDKWEKYNEEFYQVLEALSRNEK